MSSIAEIGRGIWSIRGELLIASPLAVLFVWAVSALLAWKPPIDRIDNEDYMRLYERCLAAVPAGPESTVYNDWDEVVRECKSLAYQRARREASP